MIWASHLGDCSPTPYITYGDLDLGFTPRESLSLHAQTKIPKNPIRVSIFQKFNNSFIDFKLKNYKSINK